MNFLPLPVAIHSASFREIDRAAQPAVATRFRPCTGGRSCIPVTRGGIDIAIAAVGDALAKTAVFLADGNPLSACVVLSST
jgi:hypothetical protein